MKSASQSKRATILSFLIRNIHGIHWGSRRKVYKCSLRGTYSAATSTKYPFHYRQRETTFSGVYPARNSIQWQESCKRRHIFASNELNRPRDGQNRRRRTTANEQSSSSWRSAETATSLLEEIFHLAKERLNGPLHRHPPLPARQTLSRCVIHLIVVSLTWQHRLQCPECTLFERE